MYIPASKYVEVASSCSENFRPSLPPQPPQPPPQHQPQEFTVHISDADPARRIPSHCRTARVLVREDACPRRETLPPGDAWVCGPQERIDSELQVKMNVFPLWLFLGAGENGDQPLSPWKCACCQWFDTDRWQAALWHATSPALRAQRRDNWAYLTSRVLGRARVNGKHRQPHKENRRRAFGKWARLATHLLNGSQAPEYMPLRKSRIFEMCSMVRFLGIDGLPRHLCSICLGVLVATRQDGNSDMDREIMGTLLHWLNINRVDGVVIGNVGWCHWAETYRGRKMVGRNGRVRRPPIPMGPYGKRRYYEEWVNSGDVVAAYVYGPHLVYTDSDGSTRLRDMAHFSYLLRHLVPSLTAVSIVTVVLRLFKHDADLLRPELTVGEAQRRQIIAEQLQLENDRRIASRDLQKAAKGAKGAADGKTSKANKRTGDRAEDEKTAKLLASFSAFMAAARCRRSR